MFSYRAFIDHLKLMRGYFGAAAVLFFAGVVIGGTNDAFGAFLDGQLQAIGGIGTAAKESGNPTLFFFLLIFFNNAIKSVLIIYLGALLGVAPVLFLLINGMVIGYLYSAIGESGQNAALIFLKGVLPHGIIEIPAILLACAYGLKFGTLGLRAIGAMFSGARGIGAAYETFVIRTVPVMLFIVAALLAAAVIESTLSRWLLSM